MLISQELKLRDRSTPTHHAVATMTSDFAPRLLCLSDFFFNERKKGALHPRQQYYFTSMSMEVFCKGLVPTVH